MITVLSIQVLLEGQNKYFPIPFLASLKTCLNSVIASGVLFFMALTQ